MLKTRVMPILLLKNHGLVKSIGFDSWRRIGTALPAVKVFNLREVDEIVLLDISATPESRPPDLDVIRDIASECFTPLTVGGGVQTCGSVRDLLRAGADKVCINSAAFENPQLIKDSARQFGSQCVVVSIDAHRHNGHYEAYSQSGVHPTGQEVVEWAREVERLGAGEILLTSVERDGTMQGYDLDLIRRVATSVTIPVVASGGAGNYEHMVEALQVGGASAVAAASIFHFTEQTPLEAKRHLAKKGVAVRLQQTQAASL